MTHSFPTRRSSDLSLPGLLEDRRHIVLTRDPEWQEEGAEVVHNVEQAIALANAPHISVIGGAEICALFLSRADRIELTQVHATPPGDTFLDAFAPTAWQETAREDRSEEPTSELQSLMRISYAVFCLKKKKTL